MDGKGALMVCYLNAEVMLTAWLVEVEAGFLHFAGPSHCGFTSDLSVPRNGPDGCCFRYHNILQIKSGIICIFQLFLG